MGILLSIVFNAFALWVTTFVPGILFRGNLVTLLIGGAILGLFNLIVRPLALLLSLPLLILTLGLFYFVLNGILLWLASLFIPRYVVQRLVPRRLPHALRGVFLPEVVGQQGPGEAEGDGLGEVLPRDVGRAPVHRLEHRPRGADVGPGRHAQPAHEAGAQVGHDVAVEVLEEQ